MTSKETNIFEQEYEKIKDIEIVKDNTMIDNNEKITEDTKEEITETENKLGHNPDSPYKVLGLVTSSGVHSRKTKNGVSNIAPSIGYHIEEETTGRRMYMEKEQGIKLASTSGLNNSYIRVQRREIKDKETGQVVKVNEIMYLHPIKRSDSFTQDDKIVTAFKLNSKGRIKIPYEYNIEQEKCTIELWRILQHTYNKARNRRGKRSVQASQDKQLEMLDSIKQTLNSKNVRNPFSNI